MHRFVQQGIPGRALAVHDAHQPRSIGPQPVQSAGQQPFHELQLHPLAQHPARQGAQLNTVGPRRLRQHRARRGRAVELHPARALSVQEQRIEETREMPRQIRPVGSFGINLHIPVETIVRGMHQIWASLASGPHPILGKLLKCARGHLMGQRPIGAGAISIRVLGVAQVLRGLDLGGRFAILDVPRFREVFFQVPDISIQPAAFAVWVCRVKAAARHRFIDIVHGAQGRPAAERRGEIPHPLCLRIDPGGFHAHALAQSVGVLQRLAQLPERREFSFRWRAGATHVSRGIVGLHVSGKALHNAFDFPARAFHRSLGQIEVARIHGHIFALHGLEQLSVSAHEFGPQRRRRGGRLRGKQAPLLDPKGLVIAQAHRLGALAPAVEICVERVEPLMRQRAGPAGLGEIDDAIIRLVVRAGAIQPSFSARAEGHRQLPMQRKRAGRNAQRVGQVHQRVVGVVQARLSILAKVPVSKLRGPESKRIHETLRRHIAPAPAIRPRALDFGQIGALGHFKSVFQNLGGVSHHVGNRLIARGESRLHRGHVPVTQHAKNGKALPVLLVLIGPDAVIHARRRDRQGRLGLRARGIIKARQDAPVHAKGTHHPALRRAALGFFNQEKTMVYRVLRDFKPSPPRRQERIRFLLGGGSGPAAHWGLILARAANLGARIRHGAFCAGGILDIRLQRERFGLGFGLRIAVRLRLGLGRVHGGLRLGGGSVARRHGKVGKKRQLAHAKIQHRAAGLGSAREGQSVASGFRPWVFIIKRGSWMDYGRRLLGCRVLFNLLLNLRIGPRPFIRGASGIHPARRLLGLEENRDLRKGFVALPGNVISKVRPGGERAHGLLGVFLKLLLRPCVFLIPDHVIIRAARSALEAARADILPALHIAVNIAAQSLAHLLHQIAGGIQGRAREPFLGIGHHLSHQVRREGAAQQFTRPRRVPLRAAEVVDIFLQRAHAVIFPARALAGGTVYQAPMQGVEDFVGMQKAAILQYE